MIILVLSFSSCKKEYDQATCQNLIFKQAKGLNAAAGTRANDFDKYCKGMEIKITLQQCKKATNYILTSFKKVSQKEIKSKFGEKVLNCFNKRMLRNHLK